MTSIDRRDVFAALQLTPDTVDDAPPERAIAKHDPSTGGLIGRARLATEADVARVIDTADVAFRAWREVPAPVRGDVVREIGDAFRAKKRALGALVAMETGKPRAEGCGEVQEVIDIADFAVGLSRMLYGKVIPSERRRHRILEQWHPLGPVAVITAFNFPVAVWAWNALIAAVCGDSVVWKPSSKAPFTALAAQQIVDEVLLRRGHAGVMQTVLAADEVVSRTLLTDRRVPLVSATGSTAMGRAVQRVVHDRFGKTLLELGGNNAVIVMDDADLDLATRAIVFGAVGTTGQRCTSTRRVLCHASVIDDLQRRLDKAYAQLRIGDALQDGVHVGPLVDEDACARMASALVRARAQGSVVVRGGERLTNGHPVGSTFVAPALLRTPAGAAILQEEVFAPVLHLVAVSSLDEAIAANNAVAHGLSSSIFTRSHASAEAFLDATGSDCGLANVNVGTSGAEIGGAFGGEKESGGGREAGSDSWKQYMRRQTSTINASGALPLAQGIVFDV